MSRKTAFATLTSGAYVPITTVFLHSLVTKEPEADIVVMTLPDVTSEQQMGMFSLDPKRIKIQPINLLPLPQSCQIYFGPWRVAMSKIQVWLLDSYERVVFIDSDTLVLKNCDEMFDMDELHAVPSKSDDGIQMMNSGVITLRPNRQTFDELYESLNHPSVIEIKGRGKKWFYTDQELITAHYSTQPEVEAWRADQKYIHRPFKPWQHLPYIYNALPGDRADLWPDPQIKIYHFTDCTRPWKGGTTEIDQIWMQRFHFLIKSGALVLPHEEQPDNCVALI